MEYLDQILFVENYRQLAANQADEVSECCKAESRDLNMTTTEEQSVCPECGHQCEYGFYDKNEDFHSLNLYHQYLFKLNYDKIIRACMIGPYPMGNENQGFTNIYIEYYGALSEIIYRFRQDEMSFKEEEFIGITKEEAKSLINRKLQNRMQKS